jgi:hypothetical protein
MIRTLALLLAATLPAQAATVTSYGTGCKNLTLTMTRPVLGTTAKFMVNNRSTLGLIGIGTTRLNIMVTPGCTMLTNVYWTLPYLFVPIGDMAYVPIPNNPGLIGVVYYAQAADFLKQSWSNGVKGRIGR